jgi:hypothetical protein
MHDACVFVKPERDILIVNQGDGGHSASSFVQIILLTQHESRQVGVVPQSPRITKSYQFLPPRLVRAQCFTLALLDALRQN